MLQVREEALEHLDELLSGGNEKSGIRIAVMGGAHGTGLGLIVDEAGEDDLQEVHHGIPLIINKELLSYCRSIVIGFRKGAEGSCGGSSGGGFLIEAENPLNL